MALQPWSFSMSLAPVALGNVLSWRETSQFSFPILALSTVVVLSVHAAGNAVLAYRDLDDINSPKAMVQIGALCYVLACISMLGVVCISPAQVQHLALLFFGGLSASFLDTGIVKNANIFLSELIHHILFWVIPPSLGSKFHYRLTSRLNIANFW